MRYTTRMHLADTWLVASRLGPIRGLRFFLSVAHNRWRHRDAL